MKRDEAGITLTSLVIMIIVLLILASITTYSGVSTVKYTKFIKAKSEMETMQSQVNTWYEEVNNGNTVVASYGEDITASTYSSELVAAGVTSTSNYKLFTAEYLTSIGVEGITNDFLISIPDRTAILVGGIEYQDDTYYTAEDFGISNVESTSISTVEFNLAYGTNPENSTERDIFIYNVVFYDSEGNEVTVSKFKIEYMKATKGYWQEVTNPSVVEYDGNESYCVQVTSSDTYEIKISTQDGSVSATDSYVVTDIQ